jgi:hypothetical protein
MSDPPLPNTIGSPELFTSLSNFAEKWLKQTKNQHAAKKRKSKKNKEPSDTAPSASNDVLLASNGVSAPLNSVPSASNGASSATASKPLEVSEWVPKSKTFIERRVYHLKDLPTLLMVKAEFESQADGVWSRVYGRKVRGAAWEELLDGEFRNFKNIVAVKQRTSLHDDHLIIPAEALKDEWKRTLVPRIIGLNMRSEWIKKAETTGSETTESEITESKTMETEPTSSETTKSKTKKEKSEKVERPMRCIITSVLRLTAQDKETSLYRKYLNFLIHTRTATIDTNGPARKQASSYSMVIPREVFCAGNDNTINPLLDGCQKFSANDSKPSSSDTDSESTPKPNAAVPYSLQLRNRVSLNPKTKLLEMDFDLAVTAPAGRRVLDVLREVFGDKLNKYNWNASNMEGMIADLLSGLYVARNYPHGGQNTSSNVARTWKVPFPIGQVKLIEAVLKEVNHNPYKIFEERKKSP